MQVPISISLALSCIYSEIKRDICQKSRFFVSPFDAVVRDLSEYCRAVWYGKIRMVWLSDGKKFDDTFHRVELSTQYRRVTDRRTDGRTSCDNIVLVMHSILW